LWFIDGNTYTLEELAFGEHFMLSLGLGRLNKGEVLFSSPSSGTEQPFDTPDADPEPPTLFGV
jgi:hypothetical protein